MVHAELKSVLREPLVQFLFLGGLLFLVFEWRGTSGGPGSTRIVVSPGQVEHLASGFARTWQRAPTEAELKGLIDEYVKEEIATREAAALGLDLDDTVIRRRLRQKLEFLVEETTVPAPPTDAQLQAWVSAHPDAFAAELQVSFRQVYLSTDRRGAGARAEAESLLVRLRAGGPRIPTDRLGDPTMLPAEEPLGPLREVSRSFGEDFARKLVAIEPGQWTGPVESSYGLHLVLVRERVAPTPPDLATMRPLVEREISAEHRKKDLQSYYERMLRKYTVTTEMPTGLQGKGAADAGAVR